MFISYLIILNYSSKSTLLIIKQYSVNLSNKYNEREALESLRLYYTKSRLRVRTQDRIPSS